MILNKVLLGGRVSLDPELRVTQKGTAVCNFSVAYNPPPRRNASGAKVDVPAVFIPCVLWGKSAETFVSRFKKGSAVFLDGTLKQDEFIHKEAKVAIRTNVVSVALFQRPKVTNLNFCKVFISGSVTQKPELRTLTKGRATPLKISNLAIVHFPMPYKDASGAEVEQERILMDCTCFDQDATNVAQYLDKLQHVLVEGVFYAHEQKIHGLPKPRKTLRIGVESVKFLKRETSDAGSARGAAQQNPAAQHTGDNSDLAGVGAGVGNGQGKPGELDEDVPF